MSEICIYAVLVGRLPPSRDYLKVPYQVNGIGLVVCKKGSFRFMMNREEYTAHAGETLFIPNISRTGLAGI